jgi:tetratricopeptide (TPR) repeat protein
MQSNQRGLKTNFNANVIKYILISAVAITLFFNTQMADPFNAPKMYLLILFSLAFLPYLFRSKQKELNESRLINLLVIAIIFSFIWAFMNSQSKYIALFGESQRQLGLISYLGFVIYFLILTRYTNYQSIEYFRPILILLSIVYIVYGSAQYAGKDFINWVNQYNPVIGTLGNPNFAAALMAILCTLTFSYLFIESKIYYSKIVYGIASAGLLIVIYLSNARQGLLAVLAGLLSFTIIKLSTKNKYLTLSAIIVALISFIFVVLAIFQIGPLTNYLYKESVSLRGYYWRAGINMFRDNIFTGVGLDYYGAYFKSYRESLFPLKHGYDLISTNAHNVPIQLFATGGLFVGLAYLALVMTTAYCGLAAVVKSRGENRLVIGAFFSAWIAFQTQSIVSIDNIGLTIWGWILSGILVGLFLHTKGKPDKVSELIGNKSKKPKSENFTPIWVIAGSMLGLTMIIPLSRSEVDVLRMRVAVSSASPQGLENAQSLAARITSDRLAQPMYKIQAADVYMSIGQIDKSFEVARNVVEIMPEYPTYQWVLANLLESKGKFDESIKVRNQIIDSDPQNINNFLQLVRLYVETNNLSLATQMKDKIIQLNSSSEQAFQAKSEIQRKLTLNEE